LRARKRRAFRCRLVLRACFAVSLEVLETHGDVETDSVVRHEPERALERGERDRVVAASKCGFPIVEGLTRFAADGGLDLVSRARAGAAAQTPNDQEERHESGAIEPDGLPKNHRTPSEWIAEQTSARRLACGGARRRDRRSGGAHTPDWMRLG